MRGSTRRAVLTVAAVPLVCGVGSARGGDASEARTAAGLRFAPLLAAGVGGHPQTSCCVKVMPFFAVKVPPSLLALSAMGASP